ncbi:hypothetical protein SCNRRL3882_3005 [Streptomyces chartreusis NRRL 3882]|uniref:Uncharacterized protein n=1 Tax=Streptomyces chartreusis NRRL 3882 TaxID=1079985 RepID=A0A2N9B861_STRCX|nr:hypothetical protein SCNRRL3882_3005 [Streptomyces chartreusis NRRL 3882]
MRAAGLVAAALFGFCVLGWYDRSGLHRIPVETNPEKTAAPAQRRAETDQFLSGRNRVSLAA